MPKTTSGSEKSRGLPQVSAEDLRDKMRSWLIFNEGCKLLQDLRNGKRFPADVADTIIAKMDEIRKTNT